MQGAPPAKWRRSWRLLVANSLKAGGIFLLAAAARAPLLRLMTAAAAQTAPPKDAARLLNEVADLLRPRPRTSVLGSDKAPVTIVEYASMTCPHCAHFSETTFKELKRRYIDTGKVLFILREFPLDRLGAAGFMLARCAGKDKYMAMVEACSPSSAIGWSTEPMAPLKDIARKFGFTDQSFRPVPRESGGARTPECGARRRRPEARDRCHADLLRQWKEARGRPVDRSPGQGNRPLSQGIIRSFLR